jgi:hypothetical protein
VRLHLHLTVLVSALAVMGCGGGDHSDTVDGRTQPQPTREVFKVLGTRTEASSTCTPTEPGFADCTVKRSGHRAVSCRHVPVSEQDALVPRGRCPTP